MASIQRDDFHIVFAVEWLQCCKGFRNFHFYRTFLFGHLEPCYLSVTLKTTLIANQVHFLARERPFGNAPLPFHQSSVKADSALSPPVLHDACHFCLCVRKREGALCLVNNKATALALDSRFEIMPNGKKMQLYRSNWRINLLYD